jgi:ATP-binding cassette, subfamily B, bacterial PglK
MRRRFQRYLSLIEPEKRGRWLGVVVFALVVSAVEATGALLVYGLIALTANTQESIQLPVLGEVRDLLPDLARGDLVIYSAIGVAIFFVLRAVVVLAQRFYQAWTMQQAGIDLSVRLLHRYLRLPYSFHLRRNSSELIRNANDSVNEILGSIFGPTVRLISEGFVIVAVFAVLLVTSPLATALAVLVLAPLVSLTLWVVQPRMKRLGQVSQHAGARSYQALQQSLHGYRDITVLGRQDFFLEVFQEARETIAAARYRRAVLSEFPRVTIEAVVIAFIATFIALTTWIGEGAQQSLPVIGLFAYAALRIMPAVNHMVSSVNAIRFGRAALDDIQADLMLPLPGTDVTPDPLTFTDSIRFENVSFQYEGTEEPTLRDIDLVIERGDSIGIVGSTGAGKSTLIDLIVGLSFPTQGRITIDGVDLEGRQVAWQRNIGLVSQQAFLLDDTLRRNIAIGIPEDEIDDERVAEAVNLAQLDEFVSSLPKGLETKVGERGVRVSGGQQQRVAIARALYRRPTILVFDEGTSALDNLTESALIEALARLRETHTIVTVAHRLSTVQDHDRIVFMREGRIHDVGSFDELGARNEEFRRLARWSDSAVRGRP